MTPSLRSPAEAGDHIAERLAKTWAEGLCAELADEHPAVITCRLRPGVGSSSHVGRLGHGVWDSWRTEWSGVDVAHIAGADLEHGTVRVRGIDYPAPLLLRATTTDAAAALALSLGSTVPVDLARARRIGSRLRDLGAALTPSALRAVCRLPDPETGMLLTAIAWLGEHPELSEWTARQLPIPGVHTKWLIRHEKLVRTLIRRDVGAEVRPRLTVVHFTYVDPGYLAGGDRRHDAWTTGDHHAPAYHPDVVLVVENRDCRLWFPEAPGTIVVEGEGKAVASLAAIEWLRSAGRIVYWGDIDSEGFGILNTFRAELEAHDRTVESLLMDGVAWARYAELGVDHDKHGEPLGPSSTRLPALTEDEADCYARVATAGDVVFRRIEQERIPLADARVALRELLGD